MAKDEMKVKLTQAIYEHLVEDSNRSKLKIQVDRISTTTIQFKVWPDEGLPRYFSVKVSESM